MQPGNCHYFVSINTKTPQSLSGSSVPGTVNSSRVKTLGSVKMWWVHTWNTENRQEEPAFDCPGHISLTWRKEIRICDSSAHAEIKRCRLRERGGHGVSVKSMENINRLSWVDVDSMFNFFSWINCIKNLKIPKNEGSGIPFMLGFMLPLRHIGTESWESLELSWKWKKKRLVTLFLHWYHLRISFSTYLKLEFG